MTTLRNKVLFLIALLIVFLAGILVGRCVKDFPLIEWKHEVDVVSGLSLLVTIGIAIIIPLTVKKLIDDNSGIKSFLIEEVKDLIKVFGAIKAVVSDAHTCGSFTPKNRDDINYLFHEAESKIDSIQGQMEISFKSHSQDITDGLKSDLLAYKDYLTGGELMHSSFDKVDERFYRENNNKHSLAETGLKKAVHKIYRF